MRTNKKNIEIGAWLDSAAVEDTLIDWLDALVYGGDIDATCSIHLLLSKLEDGKLTKEIEHLATDLASCIEATTNDL